MRSKIILPLAIFMGLLTTFFFYSYVKTLDKTTIESTNMTNVVTASQPIGKNQKITKEMVSLTQVPEISIHPQALRNLSDIEGFFATANIASGEILLTHRLQLQTEEKQYISRKIQEGYHGVSIGVNFVQTVSNLIEPEDRVDVVFNETQSRGSENIITTTLLLQDIRVLAVGRRMVESSSEEPYVEYTSITLELKQQDSVLLINARERGNIHFILRGKVTK